MTAIYQHFLDGFQRIAGSQTDGQRRIGAELKFPLVAADGSAASRETVDALWAHLAQIGWTPVVDTLTDRVVGAEKPGPRNASVASCETGYCKTEFSLAHVADLFELRKAVEKLKAELEPFAEKHGVHFLGYGIHPVSRPGKSLLLKKERSSFWDKAVPSNRIIPPEDGDDVHMFTVNAGSHVHVSVGADEAIAAVNVLAGFAGAQIALGAHSNVWKGELDPDYASVAESLWDRWRPARERCGVPPKAFADLEDYVRTIEGLRPIYVKREEGPVILRVYESFADYFAAKEATGETLQGKPVGVTPREADIGVHNSCYWYTVRISRYFTVENRVFDQQPPGELLSPAAVTLGLVSAWQEGWEELKGYAWDDLRVARISACKSGMAGRVDGLPLRDLAGRMLEIAALGLRRRGRGEEQFLAPLQKRQRENQCPADEVAALFRDGRIGALLDARALH